MRCAEHRLGADSARLSRWLLAGVIILALCLRVWGIDFGLPYLHHPDEPISVRIAQTIFKGGDLNPRLFHYPSFFLYLNALSYVPYFLFGKLLGIFSVPSDIPYPTSIAMGCGVISMPTTFLMGRLLTMLFGLASVLLTYLIGLRLSNSECLGLFASLMLAVSPTNVSNSRLITPDTFVVFFVLLSFWAATGIFREGKSRYYLLAGCAAGLAASAKYNGALVILPLIMAHFLRHAWKGVRERNLYLALGLSVLVFLLTTPFSLLDSERFLADVQLEVRHYSMGHEGMEGNTLPWYLSYLLSVEGPMTLLAALQILGGFCSRSKSMILLSVFPITYFAFISRFTVRNARTLLPLVPFLCLLAAFFLAGAFKWLRGLPSWKHALLLTAFSLLGLLAPSFPLLQTVKENLRLTQVDSRETARAWIDATLPLQTKIAVESYSPYVDPRRFQVQGFWKITEHPLNWYIDERFDYLVFSEGMFGRFYLEPYRYAEEVRRYELFFNNLEPVQIFVDGGYEVRVYRIPR